MNKKIYFAVDLFVLLFLLSGFIVSLVCKLTFLGILFVLVLVFFIIDCFGAYKYRKFINTRIPGLTKNIKRNYDSIILGKQNILIGDNGNSLDLRNYRRNFYTDIFIMERYYSFLKIGGVVEFYIDNSDIKYIESKRLSFLDYPLLHVTLFEHGIKINSIGVLIRKCFIGYYYLFCLCKREKKKNTDGAKYSNALKEKILYIESFCKIRNITAKFFYIT